MGICKEKKVVHKAVRERKCVFFFWVRTGLSKGHRALSHPSKAKKKIFFGRQ